MCTVTYIPLGKNDFILTSNRDEAPLRKTISPKKYIEDGVELTYPKDEVAGGTWIGLSEKKRLICLLNGGFVKHERKESYKVSRGVVVKQFLTVDNVVEVIENYDFENIEPFTIVLVDWKETLVAYELVWDGGIKHFKELDQTPKIWSSATLYNQEMKELRVGWFNDWLAKTNEFTQDNILKFHQSEKEEYPGFSFKMKRDIVETVSVTSVVKNKANVIMDYYSLL